MWSTDTPWFDVSVILAILAVGNILFGRFVMHHPRWRRLLKLAFVLSMFVTVAVVAGRAWAYALLALPIAGAAWVHLHWLPKHGIDGWTAEPYDEYLELVRRRESR
jgi:hypothetical protein